MFHEVARSGSRAVPVGLGWSSLLYRFWSSQIDSFTEVAFGSSVSTLTALAIPRVLLPAAEPGVVPEPPLEQPAVAIAIVIAARLRVRGQVARNMTHPLSCLVDCRQRVTNVKICPGSVNSLPFAVIRTVTSAYAQVEVSPPRSAGLDSRRPLRYWLTVDNLAQTRPAAKTRTRRPEGQGRMTAALNGLIASPF